MGFAVAVAVAGGLGVLARYGVHLIVAGRDGWPAPAGTFIVNIVGSFLLGYLVARFPGAEWSRIVLGVGFVGGFTTFSTLALELHRLLDGGSYPLAFAYAAGTLAAGLVAVSVGVLAGRA